MAFRIINSDGRGFCVEPDDDADSLAQMFVGETNGVANEEFLTLCSRRRRRRRVSWTARSVSVNAYASATVNQLVRYSRPASARSSSANRVASFARHATFVDSAVCAC